MSLEGKYSIIGSEGQVDYVKLRLLFGCPMGSSAGAQSVWRLQLLAEEEQTGT